MTSRVRGFTLVEVIIAVFLLSVIALGLTNTLIGAQRARVVSERWMQATQLAAEGIEQLRAGQALEPTRIAGYFDRASRVVAWNDHPGLSRLEVTVSWNDGAPRSFQLTTLVRR